MSASTAVSTRRSPSSALTRVDLPELTRPASATRIRAFHRARFSSIPRSAPASASRAPRGPGDASLRATSSSVWST